MFYIKKEFEVIKNDHKVHFVLNHDYANAAGLVNSNFFR